MTCNSGRRSYESSFHQITPYFAEFANFTTVQNGNRSALDRFELRWWRDGNNEVDFVVSRGEKLTAIEVKSGHVKSLGGLEAFLQRYPHARPLVVGGDANPLESFLRGEVPLFA